MMYKKIWIAGLFLGLLSACQPKATPEEYGPQASKPDWLYTCSQQLTDVIIHDIFKPPVASRIYAYTYLAAYEALRPGFPEFDPLSTRLNQAPTMPRPQAGVEYCYPLASLKAFTTVGRTLTFAGDKWDAFEKDFYGRFEALGMPDDVYERSVTYGEAIAKAVLAYAGKDQYKEIRGYKYTVTNEPGTWVPTPPAYAEACEPRWNTVRTFTLDSAAQFRCPAPAKYDTSQTSPFWKLTREVYEVSKKLTPEQKAIAYFWDDNAFVTNVSGHVMYGSKKMTPAGHWLAVATTVARQKNLSMMEAAEVYAITSMALYDGFIACWDEKYRSVRVRPETIINKFMDAKWTPFLETPAFPEYVSGHSVISASAGQVLTALLGDSVTFTDSTEHPFGHGVRSFTSFRAAYQEASISRLYGGIHFRDGLEEGTRQGEQVGQWVLHTLKPPKQTIASK